MWSWLAMYSPRDCARHSLYALALVKTSKQFQWDFACDFTAKGNVRRQLVLSRQARITQSLMNTGVCLRRPAASHSILVYPSSLATSIAATAASGLPAVAADESQRESPHILCQKAHNLSYQPVSRRSDPHFRENQRRSIQIASKSEAASLDDFWCRRCGKEADVHPDCVHQVNSNTVDLQL